jgi:mRNA interferase MazF
VVISRGEMWWADLPPPQGSEPGYRRPVIVMQSDAFNQSRISTVIVVALTTNLRLIDGPGNVLVPARASGLSRDSVANGSQIMTIDRDYLTERIGTVSKRILEQVEHGLRIVLEL